MLLAAALAIAIHVQAQAAASPPPTPACPKYQHDIGIGGLHNCRSVSPDGNLMQCDPDPPQCVDDMHTVLERDWQDLISRIAKLENDTSQVHTLGNIPPGPNGSGAGDVQSFSPAPGDRLGDLVSHFHSGPTDAVITYEPYDGLGTFFPASPYLGQVFKGSHGNEFIWTQHGWYPMSANPKSTFVPADSGMRDCPSDQHLHPATMPKGVPDIYGGPAPVADGRCHLNSNDQVAEHGRKLEAKR